MQQSPSNNGSIHNFSTLLKRLEAATSRLEDIALAQQSQEIIGTIPGPSALPPAASSVPAPPPPPPQAQSAAPAPAATADSPAVTGFKALLEGPLKNYADLSSEIGDVVETQAKLVLKAFEHQLLFVTASSKCKKVSTSDPNYMVLLKPTSEALQEVTEYKDKNRANRAHFNCLAEVAEGIPALGWVTLDSTPGPFVSDMKDSAQFYANRVVKEYKESNPKLVAWARSFIDALEALRKYILEHHTTGLAWNPKGVDAATYLASASGPPAAPPAPPAGAPSAPSPPPAPGAPSQAATTATAPKAKAGDLSAVFSDLNKGSDVTKGLRKVDKQEMTHKNPSLRTASTVPGSGESSSRPSIPKKPVNFQKKPAKKELDGTKWTIENFENDREIIIDDTEISHTVNVFSCKNSVIQVKGKVNAISLVGCSKTSILLDSTVSALSITSSPSFTVQILGVVPTILIDNTDGGQIYLNKDTLGVEVVTSKTSGLNISLPDATSKEEGEYVERAVPEQMKTVIGSDGKLVTTIVEHSG